VLKQDVRNILGNVLKQLFHASSSESVLERVRRLYDEHERDTDRTDPSDSAIERICADFESALVEISQQMEKVYIFIDGLDECPENARARLLRALKRLGTLSTVHLLVSSRPETDIGTAFSNVTTINIDDHQLNQPDIFRHIDWAFDHHEELRDIPPSKKEEIKNSLKAKSDGM